jgi:hypothetical protein
MKLEETIRVLYDAGVEFVIIGGVAMGLQGSAHLTKDIDSCYARTPKNMDGWRKLLNRTTLFCVAHPQACPSVLTPGRLPMD